MIHSRLYSGGQAGGTEPQAHDRGEPLLVALRPHVRVAGIVGPARHRSSHDIFPIKVFQFPVSARSEVDSPHLSPLA